MYIQTWNKVTRLRRIPVIGEKIYRWIQKMCGSLTSHERSKTESGYGGGEMMDVWCRWCNHMWQIPISEEPSKAYLKDLFECEDFEADGEEPNIT